MAQAFSSYTQELYPYTVSLVANVKFSAYLEGIASPVKSQIKHITCAVAPMDTQHKPKPGLSYLKQLF